MPLNDRLEKIKKSVAIIVSDDSRKILWVNEDFTTITGYDLGEVKGKSPSFLQGKNSEQMAIARIRHSLSIKEPFHDRITNYRKNGEEYICALSIHPIFNTDNNLTNFIALEVDGSCADEDTMDLLKVKEKYVTSNLKQSDEVKIYFGLQDYFRNEKPYLEPSLTQQSVATTLNTNEKYLSQVINNQTGKNFRHFVNRYRILEFERLLSTGQHNHLTLFGIAEKCGFKNKATFYNVVLNHTGLTPKKIAERYH